MGIIWWGPRPHVAAASRAIALAGALVLAVGITAWRTPSAVVAATSCPQGSTMDVVAHEDDDLLFLSPDLLHDVQDGVCVRTVFVTAGDDGEAAAYWTSRQDGSMAAYAEMAGVAGVWSSEDAGVPGHPMPLYTLSGAPQLSLVFMHLPDGNLDGSGFDSNDDQSLQKLYSGQIATIDTVDGSSSYTLEALTNALVTLIEADQPNTIRTQDWVGTYGDGDHSDHHTVAYLTEAASEQATTFTHEAVSYADYQTSGLPQNVFDPDLTAKEDAFFAYAQYDDVCGSVAACAGDVYGDWLARQYVLDTQSVTVSGSSGGGTNVAPLATATASSQDTSTTQTAAKAIDGSTAGYPADYTHEWATVGGKAGSWLTLTWATPVTISQVVLFDRPNSDDQITAGTLTFSNGASVAVGSLTNSGAGVTITFSARTVTSLTLTITGVSASTLNIGLAEIQVLSASGGTNHAPVANAGPDQGVATGATVHLDGSASSDPDGDALTYAWSQTAGPTVSLSGSTTATPTFTAPGTATSLTFSLTVNDGQLSSNPDTIVVTVSGSSGGGTNVAPLATATASSQDTSTTQTAAKAIDGSTAGYPADYTHEWATVGGKAGSWLTLTWATPVTISQVVLFDRPNSDDQITAGTLTFSNGASVAVGSLTNSGAGVTITFSARTVTSLTLTITGVSASTLNIGLAEIQVLSASGGTNHAPVANAGPDQGVATGATVHLDGSASSDPDGDALTYAWSQTAGPTVSLSGSTTATPTFTAPGTATSLTFSLTVNDGQLSSNPDTIVVTVSGSSGGGTNVAPLATATASSQDTSTTQTAAKAIDGSTAGYPADYTHEWATVGGKAGSWLTLTWATPVTISQVVLFDRPNSDDQITAGTLTFSNGASVAVGSLTNSGAGVTITFSARTVTSLTLTITGVSASTLNIGLAEIQAF